MPPKVARGRKKATERKVKNDKLLIDKNSNHNTEIEILEAEDKKSNVTYVMINDLPKEVKESVSNGNGESQINGISEKDSNPITELKGKDVNPLQSDISSELNDIGEINGKLEETDKQHEAGKKVFNNEDKLSRDEDKIKSDAEIDMSGDKNNFVSKEMPLKRGQQKVIKAPEQIEEKAQSKRGRKKANPLQLDNTSNLKQIDEGAKGESTEKTSNEQIEAEDEATSHNGQKKTNLLQSNKSSELKMVEKENSSTTEEPKNDKEVPNEELIIPSKRGRKKANLKEAVEKVKKEESPSPIEDPKCDAEVPAEELIVPSRRGRKKANQKEAVEIKKEESPSPIEDPKCDAEVPAEEPIIPSRRGRKKANQKEAAEIKKKESPSPLEEPIIPSKPGGRRKANQAVEVKKEQSPSPIEEPKCDTEVPTEELIIPSKRGGRRKANQKEAAKDLGEESKEAIKEQDIKKEKVEHAHAKEKQNSKDIVDRKRKNEIEKDESDFIETKILKVALQREKAIDRIVEEQTKVTEKGGAKNVKTGDKRKKDADSKESDIKSPKIPKGDSKGQSKKDKMPDVTLLDFNNQSNSPSGKPWNLKISSWNVNGVRAWLEKDGLAYIKHESPDIMTFQETKCSDKMLPEEANVSGYHSYWLAGDKDGYSGVGILSKTDPISVKYGIGIEEHDKEGRVITAEYETFYLVTAYVPNAGRKLVRLDYRMEWDKDFRSYLKDLDEKKPVILCGDLNVAHEEIDLANPKTNKKNAGFTKEEREGFSALLSEGFIDSFRHLYPEEKDAYTFWTYMMNARAKNVGWRLDYFVLSKKLTDHLCDSVIRKDVFGSDHCPITLFLFV